MDKQELVRSIGQLFSSSVKKDKQIHNAYLLVHSDRLDLHVEAAEGKTDSLPADPRQPYFLASIGKLFTSVLIGMLVDQGKLSYDNEIAQFLDDDLLAGLHVVKGTEYSKTIRIYHLLNHTSGLHDYFSDKPKNTRPMLDVILAEPERFWQAREVIQWSKTHLKAHFPPGKGFHYSDTGYHILGLIIEKVAAVPFHQALSDYIFRPLGMNFSYLAGHSKPLQKSEFPVASLYARNMNIIHFRSLSIDYAGGGIISTLSDQLKFMTALKNGQLVKKNTFERMKDWVKFFNPFFIGIDYGYGLMSFKAIPLILPAKYPAWGNAGSTGSFLFYHPGTDTYIIGSLNQFGYPQKGIQLVFKVIHQIMR